jgi:branched-chain amino acid transport system ATP-binding protein
MGIGFVPEDRRIFADLTVWENLDVAIKSSLGKRNPWTLERVFELFSALKLIQSRVVKLSDIPSGDYGSNSRQF